MGQKQTEIEFDTIDTMLQSFIIVFTSVILSILTVRTSFSHLHL